MLSFGKLWTKAIIVQKKEPLENISHKISPRIEPCGTHDRISIKIYDLVINIRHTVFKFSNNSNCSRMNHYKSNFE